MRHSASARAGRPPYLRCPPAHNFSPFHRPISTKSDSIPPITLDMTPPTQPRILCRAGASRSSMSAVAVNSGEAVHISTDEFEGSIAVRIKDYLGPKSREGPRNPVHGFSEAADTWSVQIQGRFKKEGVTADEVVSNTGLARPVICL